MPAGHCPADARQACHGLRNLCRHWFGLTEDGMVVSTRASASVICGSLLPVLVLAGVLCSAPQPGSSKQRLTGACAKVLTVARGTPLTINT
jgi:hypothetical protein